MEDKTYMIVTEVGYFLAHDTNKAKLDYAVEEFRNMHNFHTVIDIIEDPYSYLYKEKDEFDGLYEKGLLSEDEYDKKFDIVWNKFRDINGNSVMMLHFDSQM